MKNNIIIDEETQNRFMTWYLNQILMYGDAYNYWWKKEGQKSFLKWAKKQNIKYMKVDR